MLGTSKRDWAGYFNGPVNVTGNFSVGGDVYNFHPPATGLVHLGDASHRWNTVWTVNGVQTLPSDARLKRNIAPLIYGLDGVLALNPVTYAWAKPEWDDGERRYGLLAQDVQAVCRTSSKRALMASSASITRP